MIFARVAACLIAACSFTFKATAGDCPGNPDALGTFRTIEVDPAAEPHIGSEQFNENLPLQDHEVVLTFDDGPSRRNTPLILDTLAAECVKANFFIVGSMAKDAPALVKREYAEGHTIGTHTQNHRNLQYLSQQRAWKEIADGVASTRAALDDPDALSPFFRFPYLGMTNAIEKEAVGHGLMIWSIDFDISDWTPLSPDRLLALALRRLERKGKGIILLHDIHQRTALFLPKFLRELKTRGYKVVHVVPADSGWRGQIGKLMARPRPVRALN